MVKCRPPGFFFFLWSDASCGPIDRGIVHPPAAIIARATRADRALGNPPFNRLVRGFLALLAFCYSFWAAAVSGAAVAANPRRRAKARREGARAHSYASRGSAAEPWAGRSDHTMAIRGAHEGVSAPWGLGSTKRRPEPRGSKRLRNASETPETLRARKQTR
jgi:hypothetical protein